MFSAVSLLLHLLSVRTVVSWPEREDQNNLLELVFFSHHMGLGDLTQVFGPSGMCVYQLSHHPASQYLFLKTYDSM